MIENPIQTQRALLVWQPPLAGTGRRDRYAVAELVQGLDGVSFRYFDDELLEDARKTGFNGYPGLPFGSEHLDRIALEVLMRRLPPRNRGDFGDFLEQFGLHSNQSHSELSLLAYTGAGSTGDTFSVCETFDGFETPFTYMFDVAGYHHYREHCPDLAENDLVYFRREPDNEVDPSAVLIAWGKDGTTVGHVNHLQADTVGRWLDEGEISASVFRINDMPVYPRLFVRADVIPQTGVIAA